MLLRLVGGAARIMIKSDSGQMLDAEPGGALGGSGELSRKDG